MPATSLSDEEGQATLIMSSLRAVKPTFWPMRRVSYPFSYYFLSNGAIRWAKSLYPTEPNSKNDFKIIRFENVDNIKQRCTLVVKQRRRGRNDSEIIRCENVENIKQKWFSKNAEGSCKQIRACLDSVRTTVWSARTDLSMSFRFPTFLCKEADLFSLFRSTPTDINVGQEQGR